MTVATENLWSNGNFSKWLQVPGILDIEDALEKYILPKKNDAALKRFDKAMGLLTRGDKLPGMYSEEDVTDNVKSCNIFTTTIKLYYCMLDDGIMILDLGHPDIIQEDLDVIREKAAEAIMKWHFLTKSINRHNISQKEGKTVRCSHDEHRRHLEGLFDAKNN